MAERFLQLRYAATCADCQQTLAPKTRAWWDSEGKTAVCEGCRAAPGAEAASPSAASVAGGSAARHYERKVAKRHASIRARYPRLGGVILALTDEPQSTRAWAKGAIGERKLGASLDQLASSGAVLLHDRRIPGSMANIDHLAVTPSGVWVIDAKRYAGQVQKRDVGGWFSSDIRLYVGRRDCTKLVAGMAKQVAAVREALGVEGADVPVRPVLCFVDAEWGLFAKPFEVDGVLVTWSKALRERLARTEPCSVADVCGTAERLASTLPPAS